MKSRFSTTGVLAAMLCLSWVIGSVASTSVHGVAHNNSRSHDHSLRSAASKVSSLGDSDNVMLNELKEIVLFLSQKIDDSDTRIQSLEEKVRTQQLTIESLKSEVSDASSFHRFLQSDNGDCLPTFRNTIFGPRCDFSYVTRFQNRTFFNDDVVFNENVEFDSDANCLPTFNSTTRMCTLNNNFTYEAGDITFETDVEFDNDARFDNSVRFRDTVEFENEVDFNDDGNVVFRKKVRFEEDVLIKNDHHDIEFKLEDKVFPRFYQDKTFRVNSKATFNDDVTLEEDLDVAGNLKVEKMAELDDVELWGYLWVDHEARFDGDITASKSATIRNGLDVEGGLDVKQGVEISGTTTMNGQLKLHARGSVFSDFDVEGRLNAFQVRIEDTSRTGNGDGNRCTGNNCITVGGGSSSDEDDDGFFRNLQQIPPPPPPPALRIIGDVDVIGELTATEVNGESNEVDVGQITRQVKNDLETDGLRVSSLNADRVMISGAEVATFGDVTNLIEEAQLVADNGSSDSCTCSSSEIESLISTDFVRDQIDQTFVSDLGFVSEDDSEWLGGCQTFCSRQRIKRIIDASHIANLGFCDDCGGGGATDDFGVDDGGSDDGDDDDGFF